jgi:hypothetical protein
MLGMLICRALEPFRSGICVDAYCLPERKEDDDLSRDDFDHRGMSLQILTKLVEKLDLAIHCNGNTDALYARNFCIG